ncbi:reverse transcriptase/maturase family protein [Algivirga pacifica]|uniref:Reverse transcriptase domain-containing protein n=1 Tax=Algivirga pacifica TaxID=1162670 RepID=A0ABP9D2W2_9BACT
MKKSNIEAYFNKFDTKIDNIKSFNIDDFILDNFPKYPHIGKYITPRTSECREFFLSEIDKDLNSYSFDPLISFEMNQSKYSIERLHPDCHCFRRYNSKLRPIKTTSHRDRIIYAAWNDYLSIKYKKWLEENDLESSVSAYIPNTGKFNAHYAKLAFDYLQKHTEYYAIALDIKSFFDNIPHPFLKKNLIKLINEDTKLSKVDYKIYKAVTKYTYVEQQDLLSNIDTFSKGEGMYMSRTNKNWNKLRDLGIIRKNSYKGIPQGLPCSGVLANIVMMQFDKDMKHLALSMNAIYIRYADDIFIAASNNMDINTLYNLCKLELEKLKLPIAPEKTEKFEYNTLSKTHPTISYLGFNCTGNNISVRQNGVNKFYQRASQFIYSYVNTCKTRNITPSIKKIRAIFTHSGNRNYYSYLRRSSAVFEQDNKYKYENIKGILKNHVNWIDKVFDEAVNSEPPIRKGKFSAWKHCQCSLKMDNNL